MLTFGTIVIHAMIQWPVVPLLLCGLLPILLFGIRERSRRSTRRRRGSRKGLCRLPLETYTVFDDLRLPRQDGRGTMRIDHVVVSRFGIFVVKACRMKGSISGILRQLRWFSYEGSRSTVFPNPLYRNRRRIAALSEALDLPPCAFHDVVWFPARTRLNPKMPAKVRSGSLARYIRGHRREIIDPEALAAVREFLQRHTRPTDDGNGRRRRRPTRLVRRTRLGPPAHIAWR